MVCIYMYAVSKMTPKKDELVLVSYLLIYLNT